MVTNTDTQWTDRLNAIMPQNFMSNISTVYTQNNGILPNMINMIGTTVISSPDQPYNPFGKYIKAINDYGDTEQEYKVPYIKGKKFNSEDTNPFAKAPVSPLAQYNTLNDSSMYKITIDNWQLKKAFTSQQTFGDFTANTMDTLYKSYGLDMYTKWKKYFSRKDIAGASVVINETATPGDYAGALWEKMRLFANSKFRQPNTGYNVANDMAISNSVDIIMKADDALLVDDYLKGVYNLEKTRVEANFIYIDDFGTVTGDTNELVAIVLDSRGPGYLPRTPQAGAIYNPDGLYMNYNYVTEGIMRTDRYRNLVQIYKKPKVV